ncbi:RTA1 like protein [Mycena pura]|uniref:RTA1 like protein n=1 Tax=Mycena pura TaxID=153505 RepID=A0AAD6XZS8_9AGAR|nr:RTA1 like protein [Mycena pura]
MILAQSTTAPASIPPHSEYGYTPHESVAILFIVIFGTSTLLHVGQATYYRMGWLFATACLCGLGEIIGWSGRLWSSFSPNIHTAFMMQVISTAIAPTPLIAVNFVLLSWIITKLGPCYARLGPATLFMGFLSDTPLFLSSDIIALFVQAAGGSIASSGTTPTKVQLGSHILLAGIAFQLVALSIYCCLAAEFFLRYAYNRPLKWRTTARAAMDTNTATMSYALAFSTLVILVRSVYRIIQLSSGWQGRIMRTELYFNVLDGGMIALAIWTFNFAHPGRLLGASTPETPSDYGLALKRGSGESDAQPDAAGGARSLSAGV